MIAIIGILLSVLVPALTKVKLVVRNVTCRTNLRSLSLATNLYAEENEQKFFAYLSGLYINQLAPYIDDADEVRYCPATRIHAENPTQGYWGNSSESWRWVSGTAEPENGSYGLSGWCYSYPPGEAGFVGESERKDYPWPIYGQIPNPAHVPVFFDCAWVDAWPKHTDTIPANLNLDDPGGGTDNPVNNHIQRLMLRRHYGICNMAMADGHAEAYELKDLWTLKWSRKFEIQSEEMTRTDGSPIYKKTN
ncbi:MAG: type II secretion system protein [Sedimentisphaerales bacterium]|nr:type II secretion system protein [Sedimentisphaerales bacterium]